MRPFHHHHHPPLPGLAVSSVVPRITVSCSSSCLYLPRAEIWCGRASACYVGIKARASHLVGKHLTNSALKSFICFRISQTTLGLWVIVCGVGMCTCVCVYSECRPESAIGCLSQLAPILLFETVSKTDWLVSSRDLCVSASPALGL